MLSTRSAIVGITIAAGLCAASPVLGQAMRAGFNSNTLARNDDGSTGFVNFSLPNAINFYGTTYTGGYVNNNGNVTLDSTLSTFTPFNLLTTNRVILAPFFADVDTRNTAGGVVQYGTGTVNGTAAWGATFKDVGYYNQKVDKLNSFQVIIYNVQANGDFTFEFNYDKILWETGDASGGTNGLGGNSARAGWSDGDATAFEIAGSAVNGAYLDSNLATGLIWNSLNTSVNGRYIFHVVNGSVQPPVIPLPSAGFMALAGIGIVAGRRRRATLR